jgi:hypothetical protein
VVARDGVAGAVAGAAPNGMTDMEDSVADYRAFRTPAHQVATILRADDVFGLLTRRFVVPAGWVVLARRTSGEATTHPAGTPVEAGGVDELLLARADPVHVEVVEDSVPSADDYQCRAIVRLALRIIPKTGDLKSFRATMLGSASQADVAALSRYVQWPCHRSLIEFAAKRSVAELVDGQDRDALQALLTERLQEALFAAGLALQGAPEVRFDSPAWDQVRAAQADAARQRDAHAAAQQLRQALHQARLQHLSDLEALLERLQTLSESSPGADLGELVRTFAEPQRGAIYEALWKLMPAGARTQWIVAVAGNDVLCFDPQLPDVPARQLSIKGDIGPLRSVRPAAIDNKLTLLIGAARGVYRVDEEELRVHDTHAFTAPGGRELRGGVNSSAVWRSRLFATHSEVGLIAWELAAGAAAQFLLADLTGGARCVRRAQVVRDRLLFTVDRAVIVCAAEDPRSDAARWLTAGMARLTALHATGDDVYATDEVGDAWHWRLDGPTEGRRLHRGDGSPVESVLCIEAGGVPQLVIAERGTPAIQTMALGDTFVCRYETGGPGVRRCAIAADLIVAMSDTRDLLFLWRPGETGSPLAVINVAAQWGHSIQDICLVASSMPAKTDTQVTAG